MKRSHEHREYLMIELSGSFDKTISYIFEAYRFAVKLNITGYVKRCNEHEIEIVSSGEHVAIQNYTRQLKDLCGETMKMNILKINQEIAYHEFRIIKT
jgi:acylphosphatase